MVFDSGVGSLSIGGEIHRRLPHLNLIYAMDAGGFPYGEWEEGALSDHICATVTTLVEQTSPDLIVIACNSASTTVLPALRGQLSIPVVGVVPAIKPAAAISQSRVIGLLATPGTVRRQYTAQLIQDFAADCKVLSVGSGALAPAIEQRFWSGLEQPGLYAEIAQEFNRQPGSNEMDTLVLACTHFPLISAQLQRHFPGVTLIDSGEAIARRVESLLGSNSDASNGSGLQQVVVVGERELSACFKTQLAQRGISETPSFLLSER
nr:glutamate racemase [Litorivivens lipolytica]